MNAASDGRAGQRQRALDGPDGQRADEALDGSPDLRDGEREAALARLFHTHYSRLLRLAVLLGADSDAEDLVAEAFCQLHSRWDRLHAPERAAAYLRSTVCNLVRMRLRHLTVVRRHTASPVGDVVSAEQSVLLREDQRAVVEALGALPERQREALVLRYWLELRESAIAETMGISSGAVKSHASRGMAALARILKERADVV
ncbi:hypothetical protein GCM10023084_24410 [Streptomyces lacrimifluminis]|uniref:Uncharacterized protein n=1 Tax=Streptomyces lacrimifluminis TaxID=1500077 RepID=A0A917KJZ1_9ACTN|nr:sigma-70 family RNA polymerase sigma factor [Streptomyces lacrimifluminis]GGJ14780.1 hypothetical protein GCM10012282_08850 [Streptomyces lacrimifluminis]